MARPPTDQPALWHSDLLAAVPGIVHGFTTRQGGVSEGPLASLNLGARCGDVVERVAENRRRAMMALGRGHDAENSWVSLAQVHGDQCVPVDARQGAGCEADGMWTRDRAAVLATLTADCVPLLYASSDGSVIGTVHAGWRGTQAQIAAKMVGILGEHAGVRAADLVVAIGPAIGPCCFEIGANVAQALTEAFPGAQEAVTRQHGTQAESYRADLWALNRHALRTAGLQDHQIDTVRTCTACSSAELFSHRRDHGSTGRQAGLIALNR